MIGDTTSECDSVSATAVQSSSAAAFSAAIDRGSGGVEGVGIMEVCRGYHEYHARCVRYASRLVVPLSEKYGKFMLNEVLEAGNFGRHDARNRFGKTQLGHNLQRVYRDIRLVKYFPAEAMSEPLFSTWHFFWRVKNKK